MKKEDKLKSSSQMNSKRNQSQAGQTVNQNDTIKDYNRAWEDDRL
ncbi:hypothetical protein PH210_19425 [Paenibacillus sp. BSR1-1]|nr:hypothetical protein [Paenibacillus sp. BSR1-1]MDN3018354.1 hypothetical protein [Paenibacillus sp. BSR1-1]